MDSRNRGMSTSRLVAVAMTAVLVLGACRAAATPSPAASPSTAGSASQSAAASAAAATKHVSIVNKDMTDDQIKAAIQAEGGVTVGNWTTQPPTRSSSSSRNT